MYIQTSKNIQTGQSYMYVSHYNLNKIQIITLKYVLSKISGKKRFPWCGSKEYLEAVVLGDWKVSEHRSRRKGISSKGRFMRNVTEMQT